MREAVTKPKLGWLLGSEPLMAKINNKLVESVENSFIKNKCEALHFSDHNFGFESRLCFVEADFASLQNDAKSFLHSQELSVLESFPSEKRKHSYLLGRYAAKQALTHYDRSISPSDILIKPGAFQQPVVYSPLQEKNQVSLSHCDQWAVALTFPDTHPMGVDLEVSDPRYNSAIETQLTLQEKNILQSIKPRSFEKSYMIFWTIKEALSKALRIGFTSPLEIYQIEKIQTQGDHWVSEFKYFSQYQGYSFSLGTLICSLVYPKNLNLVVNRMDQFLITLKANYKLLSPHVFYDIKEQHAIHRTRSVLKINKENL